MRRLTNAVGLVLGAFWLSACTSTNPISGLSEFSASDAPGATAQASAGGTLTAPPSAETGPAVTQMPNATTTIALAPVIGAPASAIPALREGLTQRAAQRGIAVAAPGTSGAEQMLKGYFSAIADGGKTTVIYVWDVLDAAGTRLHRIQGQQSAPGGRGDGWSSVTPAVLQAIGTATIDQYAEWLSGRQTAAQ